MVQTVAGVHMMSGSEIDWGQTTIRQQKLDTSCTILSGLLFQPWMALDQTQARRQLSDKNWQLLALFCPVCCSRHLVQPSWISPRSEIIDQIFSVVCSSFVINFSECCLVFPSPRQRKTFSKSARSIPN